MAVTTSVAAAASTAPLKSTAPPTSNTAGKTTAPATVTTPAKVTTSVNVTTPAKVTTPAEAAPPTRDSQGRLICPDTSVALTGTTGAPSYTSGQQPILGVTVTNIGPLQCVRDLSGPLQVFTVFSTAGARVWSTADCFPGSGTDVRVLDPGESLQYNIRWSGTTSTPGCQSDRLQVGAGHYLVKATIGSLSATPAAFDITGG